MTGERNNQADIQKSRLLQSFLKRYTGDIKGSEVRKSMQKDLHDIYKDDFRHQYSVVTGYLLQYLKEDIAGQEAHQKIDDQIRQKLNTLKDNNELYSDEFIYAFPEVDYQKGVTKLMDHISLEIARLDFITDLYGPSINQSIELSQITSDLSAKAKDLDINIKDAQDVIVQAKSDICKQEATLKKQNSELRKQSDRISKQKIAFDKQKFDFIAILGIFSGIVLAFVGGITFVNSALQGIAGVSIYRLMAMAIICGFVLINSICLTLRYVEKIITGEFPNKIGWPLILFDALAVILLIAVCCVYWFGAPEFLRTIWL